MLDILTEILVKLKDIEQRLQKVEALSHKQGEICPDPYKHWKKDLDLVDIVKVVPVYDPPIDRYKNWNPYAPKKIC